MQYDSDQVSVKKPKDGDDLTVEQLEEFEKCAFDFHYWCENYVYVQSPKGRMLFQSRSYQERMIESFIEERFTITLCPRQAGKSTVVALYILHRTIFFPDERCGITSYKQKNVKDIMNRIKYAYESLPFWMKPAVKEYNQFTIRFVNSSVISSEVTNESTFRGESYTLIFSDELAHVKPHIAEEFWTGILPSIEADGDDSETKMIIVSTANGTAGKFAEIWFKAKNGKENGFNPVEVNWREIPGRTPEYRKKMLKKMSKNKYLQEYENAFLSDKGTLINSATLESLKDKDPYELTDELWLWCDSMQGRTILIACDVSEGVGQDYHAAQIIDSETFTQIGEWRNNDMTQTQYSKHIISMIKMCWDMGAVEVYYTVENNSIGLGILSLLQNTESRPLDEATLLTHYDSKKPGMPMTPSTKPHGCAKLKDLVEAGKFTINSERLINELKFFVKSGRSFAAESGMNDDLCMSMVVGVLGLEQLADFEEDAFEKMQEISYDEEEDGFEVGFFM